MHQASAAGSIFFSATVAALVTAAFIYDTFPKGGKHLFSLRWPLVFCGINSIAALIVDTVVLLGVPETVEVSVASSGGGIEIPTPLAAPLAIILYLIAALHFNRFASPGAAYDLPPIQVQSSVTAIGAIVRSPLVFIKAAFIAYQPLIQMTYRFIERELRPLTEMRISDLSRHTTITTDELDAKAGAFVRAALGVTPEADRITRSIYEWSTGIHGGDTARRLYLATVLIEFGGFGAADQMMKRSA